MPEAVYIEVGKRYSYAGALEWPGWCRHASGAGDPLAALASYGIRYRTALALSDIGFEPPADVAGLEITERHEGNSGTEYGVPSVVPDADQRPLDDVEIDRLSGLLEACWRARDDAVAAAVGHELRKGPRGGGRDLDATIDHLFESDVAYLGKLGARQPKADRLERQAAWLALRDRALSTFRARASGLPVADPSRTRETWPPRFYVRWAAWHALHHAWEIEDRVLP